MSDNIEMVDGLSLHSTKRSLAADDGEHGGYGGPSMIGFWLLIGSVTRDVVVDGGGRGMIRSLVDDDYMSLCGNSRSYGHLRPADTSHLELITCTFGGTACYACCTCCTCGACGTCPGWFQGW